MEQFFWSTNYLNYIRQKKIITKHVYPKYLIRNIEINNLKLIDVDDYSTISIKFLKTEYSLLWTQKLMNVGNSYIGYHKMYKFYSYDLDPIMFIHWRKLNLNYASRLLKHSCYFVNTKAEYLNNCLILRITKGGFWCLTRSVLFFIRKNNIKKFTKNYLFNNNFILLKNNFQEKTYLKNFSSYNTIYYYLSKFLNVYEHTKLFLILYKKGSLKYNNCLFSTSLLPFILIFKKYQKFFGYVKTIKCQSLINLLKSNYIFLNIKKDKLVLLNPKVEKTYKICLNKLNKKYITKLKKNYLLNFSFKRLLNKNFLSTSFKKTFLSKYYYKNKYSINRFKIYKNQNLIRNKLLKKYKTRFKTYKKLLFYKK